MKSLMMLRHAEAAAMAAPRADGQRGLTARGQTQAQRLGAWLRADDWVAAEMFCSRALRAQ